ncbi:hypothetical protein Pyn_15239 [Prunus yedoensis var. nudiflora]|uniref:Transmembrane protein n=1 Tax=Prunus yedoensis var. nudiflora TaxID=2094558 RepID=A0A314ZF79_PRUYE|nr:hypothetical protein Pyn_15239 [Prunus yedoensis var. nudiflora]
MVVLRVERVASLRSQTPKRSNKVGLAETEDPFMAVLIILIALVVECFYDALLVGLICLCRRNELLIQDGNGGSERL